MPLGGRRIGRPGLVRTMARTAVISGTATAVGGAPPAPAPAAGGGDDVLAKRQQLADLKAQGILDDAEFTAAKAKLLGTSSGRPSGSSRRGSWDSATPPPMLRAACPTVERSSRPDLIQRRPMPWRSSPGPPSVPVSPAC